MAGLILNKAIWLDVWLVTLLWDSREEARFFKLKSEFSFWWFSFGWTEKGLIILTYLPVGFRLNFDWIMFSLRVTFFIGFLLLNFSCSFLSSFDVILETLSTFSSSTCIFFLFLFAEATFLAAKTGLFSSIGLLPILNSFCG